MHDDLPEKQRIESVTQAEIDKGAEPEEAANFENLRRPFSEADTTDPHGQSFDSRR